jgi:hypothetical protein
MCKGSSLCCSSFGLVICALCLSIVLSPMCRSVALEVQERPSGRWMTAPQ